MTNVAIQTQSTSSFCLQNQLLTEKRDYLVPLDPRISG
jgi:hypothetical protein